jgi:oligopeptide transport system permease protein
LSRPWSGPWHEAALQLRENRVALAALGVLGAIAVLTLVGPMLNPNRFDAVDWAHAAVPPAAFGHWLGTDRLGRDLFVRTLAGARISLVLGLLATSLSVVIGVAYGAVAGFCGGGVDHLMMRLIEILSGLPLIFFVILLTVSFGRSPTLLFASIGAVGWLTIARIVRGHALSIRRREFIEAAIAGGTRSTRIITRHVVPNLLGPVIVYATLLVPQMILFESFLSFLGLGIQEPQPSLGALIADGAAEIEIAPWILLVPGGLLAVLLACFNVLGDALSDALDVDRA